MNRALCSALRAKIDEQIERIEHLIELLPEGSLDWKPAIPGAFSAGVLLGHLLECLAGFCAVLYAVKKESLRHFADLRDLPVNHRCNQMEARQRIIVYSACIDEGFALLQDSDLEGAVPTVFVCGGEPLLTLVLGNLEHLISHKHQLFMYLRLIGVSASSKDLYHFRGE